ncbi:MAG: chemotaxis-specific protein-glutamate methyltransferase CheB [Bdellovibrionota bacterium]
MNDRFKIDDLRLKWANVSDLAEGWNVDVRDWALLHWRDDAGERISCLRLDDINQEYRLKLYRRLQELKASGKSGSWTFHIPPSFSLRVQDLVQGEFASAIKVVVGPRLKIQKKQGRLEISQKIRIMTVDDSRTMQKLIEKSLSASTDLEIIAQVVDPLTAIAQVKALNPDILTLDIHMPGQNGVEVLKDLMREYPRPAVLLTSLSKEDGTLVFEGLAAGAFEYLQKPSHEDLEQFRVVLESTLVAAFDSRDKVSLSATSKSRRPSSRLAWNKRNDASGREDIILIGSSTGGTVALGEVLPLFNKSCPPIVVVQHIPAVFSRALAESLNRHCEIEVVEAQDGMVVEAGRAYIAPGGLQLALVRRDSKLFVSIRDDAPVNRFKPSVDYLFKSATQVRGLKISAALLTGMGRDGAQGLLELKQSGAWTIAQDESTSVVYGMPRAAKEIGADCQVLPLGQIAEALLSGLGQAS